MTTSVLKQDPNTKRFKSALIYFDTGTQYAHFQGSCFQSSVNQTLTSFFFFFSVSLFLNLFFTKVYLGINVKLLLRW